MLGGVYRTTGTWGIFGGRTELTEASGTGINIVPNLTGMFVMVFRPYRKLAEDFDKVVTQQIPQAYFSTYHTEHTHGIHSIPLRP